MKKILYIDLDGVVADFDHSLQLYCPNIMSLTEDEISLKVDEVCLANKNIFHDLKPIENAINCIEVLDNLYEIYFLSTPMWIVPESFTGKRLWIEKHFGELSVKKLILTHRKDLNIGDYLIDDSFRSGVDNFKGEHIHFGTDKFPDWISVYNYLKINHETN